MFAHFRDILITILLFYSSTLLSQDIVLAVIDFEGKGVSQTEASALTDRLRTEVVGISDAIVVERAQMDEVLEEQGFQQSGCVTSECMVEVGRLLGANQMVGGSISKVGNTFSVNARIINVETGEIINSISYDYSGVIDELLISGMRNVGQLLFTANNQPIVELSKDIEYYDNGNIKAEGRSILGVKIGRWVYYHENGRIKAVGNYKDGNKDGAWIHYLKDGKIKGEFEYKNGHANRYPIIRNGVEYIITSEFTEVEALHECDGYLFELYEDKSRRSVHAIFQNKFHGEFRYYYPNGQLEATGQYSNGIKVGKWEWYYDNGQIMVNGRYDENGEMVGRWRYYNEDGSINSTKHSEIESLINEIDGLLKRIHISSMP